MVGTPHPPDGRWPAVYLGNSRESLPIGIRACPMTSLVETPSEWDLALVRWRIVASPRWVYDTPTNHSVIPFVARAGPVVKYWLEGPRRLPSDTNYELHELDSTITASRSGVQRHIN